MSVKPHSATQEISPQEEVVLVRHTVEAPSAAELSERERHEHTVAWLRLLWGERTFLFRSAICGLLVSIFIAFVIPKRYMSTTRLMPPDNQSSSGLAMAAAALAGGSASPLGGIAGDLLGLKSTSDVFVGILTSRTAEDALIEKFGLKKVYGDSRMEDARKDLADHTSIGIDRKSQIITIAVTDRDPQRAAAMAQTYVDELDRLVAELSTSSARRERIFLEGRLQTVNQDLESSETNFSQFASKNTAINVPEQAKAMVDAAATLQGQLIAAQSELEGLKQIYTDNNVRVRSAEAKVEELRHQLEKLAGKGEGTAEDPPNEKDSLYPSIRKLPVLGVTYADLYRKTKVEEAIFESLTQEYELAKVEEAKEIPTVRVLDPPDIPGKKSFPPRSVIVALGVMLSVSFAIACVMGRARWTAVDATDPRKVFATEVFTTVKARLPRFSQNGSHAEPTNADSWKSDGKA